MFGERLKYLRKKKRFTQANLASMLNVSQQTVAKWEGGKSFPDSNLLIQLAQVFQSSLDFLLEQDNRPLESDSAGAYSSVQIPILGVVRAGYGTLAYEELLGYEQASVSSAKNYFYLQVQGDSMEPRIKDGDLALVKRQPLLENGDLGVVVYGDGEGTIKKFSRKGTSVVLQPFNPLYETVILEKYELEHLYIIGKVVETKARW
ncbi:MAG: XRE family transcriptional regulator [Syntrophomonadaceae bacterium]|jgi:repressor LexA|nr:XRE family transcriptional regulator [Syntrophomonadaceae bacterium]